MKTTIENTEVKSGEYKIASVEDGKPLVTVNLSSDIAFVVHDAAQQKTMLARNIPLDSVKDIFAEFGDEGGKVVQITGGDKSPESKIYFDELLGVLNDIYPDDRINITSVDALEELHFESISVDGKTGAVAPYINQRHYASQFEPDRIKPDAVLARPGGGHGL